MHLEVLLEGNRYLVDGNFIGSRPGIIPLLGGSRWDVQIDSFVTHRLRARFLASLRANAGPLWPGVQAFFDDRKHGYTLAEPSADSGFLRVCPTHAEIFHDGPTVFGNFLLPGRHWEELKTVQEEHEHSRSAAVNLTLVQRGQHRRIRVALRILSTVPPGTSRTAARETLEASRRIRSERRMVFATRVGLEAASVTISFDPIEGPTSRLLVPFRLETDNGDVDGGLVLGDVDPLHIEIYNDSLRDDVRAWSTALRGFSDLTTYDLISPARAARASQPRDHDTHRVQPRHQQVVPRRPPTHRHHPWPSHLTPLGSTASDLACYVGGHIRRLGNRHASPEARTRAQLVGIRLRPGETWVRPHVRGIPRGDDVRFAWHPERKPSRR